MPYDPRIVGQQTTPVEHEVDARWLMAYAAGIGDCSPSYMDTASGTVIGHPLFPVCLEWPVKIANSTLSVPQGCAVIVSHLRLKKGIVRRAS